MKILFYAIAFFGILSTTSCGEGNVESRKGENPKQDVALPASAEKDNDNVLRTTGEVIVFFEPSLERAKELSELGGKDYFENMKGFQAANSTYIERLQKMGYTVYTSRETNIKLTVSESQVNVINTLGVSEGYGVVMGKLGESPKVIRGIPGWEELEKEVKAYYNK